jgi:Putative MetA-pathway of phenol degradation
LNSSVIVAIALVLWPLLASAQELEPGAYWPIPKGLNIVTGVAGFNWGDVNFDPALPVEDASARINTMAFAFTRGLSIAGRTATIGLVVPVLDGHVEGLYIGEHTEVDRFGFADPKIKVAVNLYGAPAMTPREFLPYRQRWLVGVSLTMLPPLGEYDSTKLINLGSHRWSFKPEVGVSRTKGRWVMEMMAGVWVFTDNTKFAGGRTREQDPILSTQAHLTYRFKPSVWLAADGNYYTGGRTTVGGNLNLDLQRNSRVGATFSKGLGSHQAIRASVSRGAYTTIGADFTSIAFGYNYAWVQ